MPWAAISLNVCCAVRNLLQQPHRVEAFELRRQLLLDRRRNVAMGFGFQLERGLEEVDGQPRLVQLHQSLRGLEAAQAARADQPSNNGAVLLLDPSLIVLLVGPGSRLLKAAPLAVVEYGLAHEGAAVVRVNAEHREGQIGRREPMKPETTRLKRT
jgi:hypothetical protein